MAKRRRTKSKTRRRTTGSEPRQGWAWGLFGLGVGLSVSAFIYLNSREPVSVVPQEPAAEARSATKRPPPRKEAQPEETKPKFTFYDMLPTFEVVIPEEDLAVVPNEPLAQVASPGIYVLQAGSFSRHEDADSRRAELAMLGIESGIQKVSVEDKVYHRVRIGPVDSLDRLNELRRRLRGAEIDVMVIRVGE